MSVRIDGSSAFLRTDGGWIGKIGGAILFFGDKNSDLPSLRRRHPNASFAFLNQVHSDQIHGVADAPAKTPDTFTACDWPEADAHVTSRKSIALCVRTADCVPVLIASSDSVAAVHAGWRGLESEIIQKTILKMRANGVATRDLKAVIGPHIGEKSFEVGRDVSERLNAVFRKLRYNPAPISRPHPADPEKRRIDMSTLAQAQLIQSGVPEEAVTTFRADTFTDPEFHSFRRDKTAGRQISFILMM